MPYVADTHSLIWYMTEHPNLSLRAKQIFEATDHGEEQVVIPCIVFFELLYLVEKGKIEGNFDDFLHQLLRAPNYKIEPLCLPIIQQSRIVSKEKVADPWDRLIVATSLHLGLPLITRDRLLHQDALSTIGLKVVW